MKCPLLPIDLRVEKMPAALSALDLGSLLPAMLRGLTEERLRSATTALEAHALLYRSHRRIPSNALTRN